MPPSGSLVALPIFSDTASGTTIVHYSITGSTENALIQGMEASGSSSCELDALACFQSRFSWSYTTQTVGTTCTVTTVSLTKTYTMHLPEWTGPALVPSRLAIWWTKVHDHILWHETQHLDIANGFVPSLEAGIKSGPCDSVASQQKANTLLAQLKSQQAAFDKSDSSWTYPAY